MKFDREPDRIDWTAIGLPIFVDGGSGRNMAPVKSIQRAWTWDRYTIREIKPNKRYDLFRTTLIRQGSFKSLRAAQLAAEKLQIVL